MYDVGFIERYGSGIRMMKRLSEEWGNKEPRYELHLLETKVIFDSPIQESTFIEIDDISAQLNERQKKCPISRPKKRANCNKGIRRDQPCLASGCL